MENIKTHFTIAAKAWVAAVLPILVGLVAGVSGAADIDIAAWAGIIGLSTAQWVGVYFKTNYYYVEV
tara:strand:- start:4363 stop:4563 length:201 start_codon:yes stop_codon:yes gene_type:complete